VSDTPKQLSGLQRICKRYGRMKIGDTMMAWDYAKGEPVEEAALKADKERWKASERAKWKGAA